MNYTDLRELKSVLQVPAGDLSEDVSLNFIIEQASRWIDELLGIRPIEKKSRTEFYAGTGTQKLLLRARPVFTTPALQVYLDEAGWCPCGDRDLCWSRRRWKQHCIEVERSWCWRSIRCSHEHRRKASCCDTCRQKNTYRT